MNEWKRWKRVVVRGSEKQLLDADDALYAAGAYGDRLVYADEGGDGWAAYFVTERFLGRFSRIVARCGCGIGGRIKTIQDGTKGAIVMRNNPAFGVWDRDDDPLPFRGPIKSGGASSPVEDEVMTAVEESPEVMRLRAKIQRLIASGEKPSWDRVIDIVDRDAHLATKVSTKLVQQILHEFT